MSFKSVILICLIILCNVLICSRSPLFTFQIASRCWIYPGSVLVVANEYTLCFPLFQAYAGLEQKFLNDQFSIFLFVNYCKIKITSSILEKLPPVNIHVDNLFFHFFQAYGGLRGAVAFSLVDLLEHGDFQKNTKDMFMTTCLALIFFTVFVQVSW